MRKINVVLFLMVCLFCIFAQYIFDASYLNKFSKPWHMQPFVNEDSLSTYVQENYGILDRKQVYSRFADSSKAVVNILVDAWGLPMEDSLVMEDFSLFEKIPHVFAVHHRQLNFNTHAEKVELRNNYDNSLFLFGGDSLEYNRNRDVSKLGFKNTVFCQYCTDETMTGKVDSLLAFMDSLPQPFFIGFTTQSSRGGNRDSLLYSLNLFSHLAQKHPNVIFVIQGTHRPILGTPETRKRYYAHWVPVVILNSGKNRK